ncbi:hypothetical protein B0H16DRAFT_677660 [Mycena metata]|uniref:Uncharacterized protein n=1 Tax=Mycena metata TaxID=1033252 RepID=A0AAD7NEL7_9AGAR|nr:hypothetical protein B0H16DRAFT_677660 [Mycena metata]
MRYKMRSTFYLNSSTRTLIHLHHHNVHHHLLPRPCLRPVERHPGRRPSPRRRPTGRRLRTLGHRRRVLLQAVGAQQPAVRRAGRRGHGPAAGHLDARHGQPVPLRAVQRALHRLYPRRAHHAGPRAREQLPFWFESPNAASGGVVRYTGYKNVTAYPQPWWFAGTNGNEPPFFIQTQEDAQTATANQWVLARPIRVSSAAAESQ